MKTRLSDEGWSFWGLMFFFVIIVIWDPFVDFVRSNWVKALAIVFAIALIVVAFVWGSDLVEGFIGMMADFNEMCEEQYKSMGLSRWLEFN